jgi:hypothetical protein
MEELGIPERLHGTRDPEGDGRWTASSPGSIPRRPPPSVFQFTEPKPRETIEILGKNSEFLESSVRLSVAATSYH